MLLGRDRERQALERVLTDARAGRSGVLVLVGESGIGKTALLEHAAGRAEGMRVLRARGIESEAQIPFAGLLELLRPALDFLDRIPPPQEVALEGALALRPASAQDRFAIGAATLSLLAACAEEAPLAVLVDDAHWLDGSSAEALLFAVRRLVADSIAVVLTMREGEPSLFERAGLTSLHIPGLDREEAAALLEREARDPIGREAADRLYRATAGNPLALLELAPEASALAAVPLEAPVPVSTSIARAFLRRAGSLPEETRRVLVLAAASDQGDLALVGRAASSLGLDVAALAAAETAGLVDLAGGRAEFRHPLARSAIYGEGAAEERREAHRALAGALPDRDVDRRAWHLATAAVGPDDAASAALEQAGDRARARSAYAVAAASFERAARLAPEDERRIRLLTAAADAAWLAGLADRTVALLDEARAHDPQPPLAIRIEHLRGHVAMRRGPVMEGHAILVAAAERAASDDPDLASLMLAEAAHGCFCAGDAGEMVRTARRGAALARGGEATLFATLAHGMALVFAGEGDEGAALLRRGVAILEASAELRQDPRLLAWAAMGPLWLREEGAARALVARALEAARGQAAVGVLPFLLQHVAIDHATSDRPAPAYAAFDEAIRLARETGQRTDLAATLAQLARLEARQGREAACREHAAEARGLGRELGVGLAEVWAIAALGELELGLGRPAVACEYLEELRARLRELAIADADMSPAPELVEAYVRLGRADDAAAEAGAFEAEARGKGQPWALARATRCLGLLARDDDLEPVFEEALRLHERTPDVFETARTRLVYGARLRRARQRVRAREELRAALAIFDRVGAAPWAELARAELAATGETARRRDASTLDQLTPQELQIALLLAEGKTTREAAAALFLSPKTVEYHLRHVYRKLSIRSREELARAFPSSL